MLGPHQESAGSLFVNLVAHEVGNKLGANHTFSFNSEGTGVNVEPASGSMQAQVLMI